jgi:WD40 repeat protein
VRIFLSYGHDEYTSLAVRIKRDLEGLGHEVWFDVERLKPGGDWERYIDEGLERVSASGESGRFLLLMTPHSVRRPDGYCLNELARAFGRNLPIVPVMVSSVEPPLSICRLQYLDIRNCFPAEQHEERYKNQFSQLVVALEEKQVPFEGIQQRLRSYLQPSSYDDDLARHLSRFTGREWAMAEFNEWLISSHRVLWITGEAGVGKSALAAWLCNKRPEIVAYHFCRYANSDRVDARRALFSLAYQLSTQISTYKDRLNASQLDKIVVETNVPTVFDRLFVEPLNGLAPISNRPHILLIDAIDEARRDGKNELATLIGSEFDRLPPWLRLIVTSRPYEQDINFALQSLDPWKLDAGRRENLSDIRKYLYREMLPFSGHDVMIDQVVTKIIEKSEGLFLYVTWVRQELQDRRLTVDQLEQFPKGLGGIYADSFKRYFPDLHQYQSDCRPALEAICAAREPLAVSELSSLLGWSDYQMRALAARLGSLFPEVDNRLRPFHQSVRDWLTDPQRSGHYYVDVTAQENRLADFAWQEYRRGVSAMGRYCVMHAPSHFVACQRKTELKQLLLDYEWIEAKLNAGGIADLLADYEISLDAFSKSSTPDTGTWFPISVPPWRRNDTRSSERRADTCEIIEVESLTTLHGALRLSGHILASDKSQLPGQLWGRLGSTADPHIKQMLSQTRSCKTDWIRPITALLTPPGGALVGIIHTGVEITSMAVTPYGHTVIAACRDETLRLWELESGRLVYVLSDDSGHTSSVALTPDGKFALKASSNYWLEANDATLAVWDLTTRSRLRVVRSGTGNIEALAITPDGTLGITASGALSQHGVVDCKLDLWELATLRKLRTLAGHSDRVTAVAVTPDGETVVSGCADGTMRFWDLASGRELRSVAGHSQKITALAVTSDGERLVSASQDETLKLWTPLKMWATSYAHSASVDTVSRLEVVTLEGHSDIITTVAVTPDGKLAVSASTDRTLKVWELDSGSRSELHTFYGHSSTVTDVAVFPDGKRAVSASSDKTLRIWKLAGGRTSQTPAAHSMGVNALAVSSDGNSVVSGSYDGRVKVWELASSRELRLSRVSFGVGALTITPDSKFALIAAANRQRMNNSAEYIMTLFDLTTGGDVRAFETEGPSSEVLTSFDRNAPMDQHRLGQGGKLHLERYPNHYPDVNSLAITPDGKLAIRAAGSISITDPLDGTLTLWEVHSGVRKRTIAGPTYPFTSLAVTPDGETVVSGCADGTMRFWDLASGRELGSIIGHSKGITGLAVTLDGKRLVSCSRDKTLKVWELGRGIPTSTLVGHTDEVNAVVVSKDGKIAVSASEDKTLKLWNIETGNKIATYTSDAPLLSCVISPDNVTIVAGDQGGAIHWLRFEQSLHG